MVDLDKRDLSENSTGILRAALPKGNAGLPAS